MIILILLISLLIRLINLNQSLWWDEAINIKFAQSLPFWEFVSRYSIADFHPPGYFVIIWLWGHVFGFSEISMRLPSVIFSLLTVLLTYLIGKRLFSRKIGLLASLFLALAPLHIYYAQEARMYSFAAFAATFSIYFFISLIKRLKLSLILYSLSVALVLCSDYVAYFVLLPQFIYVLLFQRQVFKIFATALFFGFLPTFLIVPIFFEQIIVGVIKSASLQGWGEVVGGANIKNAALLFVKILVGKISFDNKLVYALVVVVASSPYICLILRLHRLLKKHVVIVLFWLIIPPLAVFLLSFYIPVFNYSRLIFLLPPFYLITAFGLAQFNRRVFWILAFGIITAEVIMSGLYLFNTKFHREDWRTAVNFVENKLGDKDVVLFEDDSIPAPYAYYSRSLDKANRGFVGTPARSMDYVVKLSDILKDKQRVFVFEYLVDITDPNRFLERRMEELGFRRIDTYDFRGVGFVRLYQK